MFKTPVLLLALITLSCSQIIPNTTPDASNFNFTEQSLNLTDLSADTQAQLDNCLSLVNDSNIFIAQYQLGAAVQRLYPDGYKEYYLYLDVFDSNDNIHQFQAIVAIQVDGMTYVLQQIAEGQLNSSELNSNQTLSVTQTIITQTAPSASSLSDLYASIANGFSQLSDNDTASDKHLSEVEAQLAKDYVVVPNATLAAVYRKSDTFGNFYLIFYESINKPVVSYVAYVVADTLKKVHYILSFNKVDTSSIKAN